MSGFNCPRPVSKLSKLQILDAHYDPKELPHPLIRDVSQMRGILGAKPSVYFNYFRSHRLRREVNDSGSNC